MSSALEVDDGHTSRQEGPNSDLLKLSVQKFFKLCERYAIILFIYSIIGLGFGLICTLEGMILFFNGITGSTKFSAAVLGMKTDVTDAAPGVVLFVVGMLTIFITRFSIPLKMLEKLADPRGRLPWAPINDSNNMSIDRPLVSKVESLTSQVEVLSEAVSELAQHAEGNPYDKTKIKRLHLSAHGNGHDRPSPN